MDTKISDKLRSNLAKRNKFDISNTALGRKLILICFITVLLTLSGTCSGWQGFVSIFERNKVYNWLCSDTEENNSCPEQRIAIQYLYSIAISGQYLCHTIAALLKDIIGLKKLGTIGTSFVIIGYLMLSISSKNLQLYIPALLLIGSSTDFIFYSALSSLQLLPNVTGFLSGLLVGSSIFSWLIPVLLDSLDKATSLGFDTIFRIYSLVICVPLSILFVTLLPNFKFEYTIRRENGTSEFQQSGTRSTKNDYNFYENENDDDNVTLEILDDQSHSSKDCISSTHLSDKSHRHDSDHFDKAKTSEETLKMPIQEKETPETLLTITKGLLNAIKSRHFLMFLVLWSINSARFNFFQISSREIYGIEYSIKLAYITPVIAFFGTTLHGLVIDIFGLYTSLLILNIIHSILQTSLFFTVIYDYNFLKWIGIMTFPLCIANTLHVITLTRTYYPHVKFYSALNGFCFLIAAAISYSCAGLFSATLQLLDGDFRYPTLVLTLFTLCLFPYIIFTQYINTYTLPFNLYKLFGICNGPK